jgi:imidazolonepropionase-like amidohydrolase
MKKYGYIPAMTAILIATIFGSVFSQEMIAILADRMIDVVSGKVWNDAVIVVEGDRIMSAGRQSVPRGAEVIDLGDMTLLPGFIDMHTHITSELSGNWVMRPVTETAADAALKGVQFAKRTVMAGFTTIRNVGSSDFVDVSLMHAVENGTIIGPWIIPAGHSLGVTGGHCDITGFKPGLLDQGIEAGIADGVDEVIKAVRYQIKYGAKVIKICATAGVLSFEGPVGAQQYSEEEMLAIVEEADRHGIKVAAHAHGTEGIIAASRAGIASIEHGSMLTDEAIRVMKENGTYLVPTTYLVDVLDLGALPAPIRAKAEYILPLARESLRKAIRAGVKIAFGTDAGVYPHGDNPKEFAVLVRLGMEPIDALRTATVNAADLLGVSDRGLLEAGRFADIIAVPGNPLDEIRVVEDVQFVMHGGKILKQP